MSTLNLYLLYIATLFTAHLRSVVLTPPQSPPQWFQAKQRTDKVSSFPYISGDTFATIAHVCIDELRTPFDTDAIRDGDIIFVRANLINYFFDQVHPHLKAKYILITHNEDNPAIGNKGTFLDDPKLIAWFALNVEVHYKHPKLHLIPIGIANSYWPFGKVEILNAAMQKKSSIEKRHLIYLNFYKEDTRESRIPIENLFKNKPWAYIRANRPWNEYLEDIASSLFVLSPHGNGLDCYRTWEALLMGSIPVVKTSSLDPLYEDLPVVIVQEWEHITEEFLITKYHEMARKTFKIEKIFMQYWFDLIKECRNNFLRSV